jgi:dolichyl-phosphate-mannose-protein mannosyltransferase
MTFTTLVNKYYPTLLLTVLFFAFFTRVYNLNVPEKYVFDEVYHVVTAKLIAKNDNRAYDWHAPAPEPNTAIDWLHPPLAKYTQAFFINTLGDSSFSWRFSSAVFGTLVVFLTALLAREVFGDKKLALIAAFLVSLDGLVLTMSRITMNDIHVTAFILLSLLFYFKYLNSSRKNNLLFVLSVIAGGLAVASKWSGAFVLGIIGILEGIFWLKSVWKKGKIDQTLLKKAAIVVVTLLVLPITIYVASYSQMFLLGGNLNTLHELHKNIWYYQTNLSAEHPAQSTPWQWFWNTKPVWVAVDYGADSRSDIYIVGNPVLFLVANVAVMASVLYLMWFILEKRSKSSNEVVNKKSHARYDKEIVSLSLLLFAYFAIWVPWQASPRIMFFYHYLPAVPLLCINLGFWLNKLIESKKYSVIAYLALVAIFVTFIIWYPHWTYWPTSLELKDNLYFMFDFWKQT